MPIIKHVLINMINIIIENCCIISNPNVVVLFNIAEETGL
jgi:hypothetical protein